ncbi:MULTISPECIES: M15 family metallopeptidase [unclassified Neochlamydia]|uniref:M15 family metallopeptidase n=1 Tax=unclassified Neochlamydia TaxID=2643326 RepID=UPI001407EC0B|nr:MULTISPECIES: M15 family metallopeptidase [unclassified Neochlamydia]NGY95386.1 hypothetical protein [Neochlamydia sp. AcF84]
MTTHPRNKHPYLDKGNRIKGMICPDTVCYKAFTKRGWKWGGDWQVERAYVNYLHYEKDLKDVSEMFK